MIVLASASPRRKELMEMLGFQNIRILPARGEEHADPALPPQELVMALASEKGREVAAQCEDDDVVIAADTIVWFDGRVFGKPHSREQAVGMLRALSGNTHEVYTGVSVRRGGKELLRYEKSAVHFRELTEEEIGRYVDTGEPMDKAGAYGVQGFGSLFVSHIDGDFFTVMGLPVCELCRLLRLFEITILA